MEHTITALTAQKRNHQRVNVYLDGEFAFGLSRLVAAWLQVGQTISDEKVEQLKADDGREVAYQQATRYLAYRPRSEAEVRQHLESQDLPPEAILEALVRLAKNGLLNDSQFAQTWIENRSEFRPRGRRALAYELKHLGVNPQVVERALEGVDENELAYQAGLKQIRKYQHLEWQLFRQKMYAFLARRGFSYEVSNPVVARLWAEQHQTDPTMINEEADE
jgi:regulatory protein